MSPERRTRTAEKREPINVEWERLLDEALEAPGQMGNTYNRFYRFSLLNQMLVRMQGVSEPIATYKGWGALDRQVQRGSKAKFIYRPLFKKELNELGVEEQKLKGFKLVPCIFGLSETEGAELPEVEPLQWSKERALGALAITQVAFDQTDGNIQGFSRGREFAINPLAAYPLKTTWHEWGHIEHGHTTPEQLQEYRTHRGLKEAEAETTAYLGMHAIGAEGQFDAAESRSYIQTYLDGNELPETSIRRIFTVTDRIYSAGIENKSIDESSER